MSAFDDWDVQLCDVRTPATVDDAGGPVASTEHLAVPCQIDSGAQLMRTGDGVEWWSSMRVHLELQYLAWFPLNATVTARGVTAEVTELVIVDDGDPDLDGFTVVLK